MNYEVPCKTSSKIKYLKKGKTLAESLKFKFSRLLVNSLCPGHISDHKFGDLRPLGP